MTDTFEFTLDNPLTDEQWDMIADVDFDHTDRIWFHTKHGKEVEFAKVIRCKDCKHYYEKEWVVGGGSYTTCWYQTIANAQPNDFCSRAERKEDVRTD